MFQFEFVRALFTFKADTPAFEASFELPPTRTKGPTVVRPYRPAQDRHIFK